MQLDNQRGLVSILIANYNNGKFLEECLDSIFKQTYTNWEIIIVDDASTDIDSRGVYEKYSNHSQIKIYYNIINKGCGYTKRKCIEYSRGEFCGFVDPDDTITVDAIEKLIKVISPNKNISIVYSTHFICDEKLNIIKIANYVGQIPQNESHLTFNGPKISQFVIFRKESYNRTNGINPRLKRAVDQDLYLKLEEVGTTTFINEPLYYYRHQSNSISLGNNKFNAFKEEITCLKDAIKRRNDRHIKLIVQKRIIIGLINFVYTEKSFKRYKNAIEAYFLTYKINPQLTNWKLHLVFIKTLFEWLKTKIETK